MSCWPDSTEEIWTFWGRWRAWVLMPRAAGRPKDFEVIAELEEIRDELSG